MLGLKDPKNKLSWQVEVEGSKLQLEAKMGSNRASKKQNKTTNKQKKPTTTNKKPPTTRNATHLLERLKSRTLTPPSTGRDVERQGLSLTAGGNAKWHSHFGGQVSSVLQHETCSYCITYPSQSLEFTQKNLKLRSTQKSAHGCL